MKTRYENNMGLIRWIVSLGMKLEKNKEVEITWETFKKYFEEYKEMVVNSNLDIKILDRDLIYLRQIRYILSKSSLPNLHIERPRKVMRSLDKLITNLEANIYEYSRDDNLSNDLENINAGFYQHKTRLFTYNNQDVLTHNGFLNVFAVDDNYLLHGMVSLKGLRCTVAIPQNFRSSVADIYINFFGTVDFASIVSDIEKGGPGHKTINKYMSDLVRQTVDVIQQMSELCPGHKFRLKLLGHSLGGALAKNFAHILQKVIATKDKDISDIIERIENNLIDFELSKKDIKRLEKKLKIAQEVHNSLDQEGFDTNCLDNISGITVYAWGSPGVSKTVNKLGILMSYFYDEDFIRIYNHYHHEDIIVQFGESEFLVDTGTGIAPNILVNNYISYNIPLTDDEINNSQKLPFPGCSKKVMAAHLQCLYDFNVNDLDDEMHLSYEPQSRFTISPIEQTSYHAFNFFGNSAVVRNVAAKAGFKTLKKNPDLEIDLRELDHKFYEYPYHIEESKLSVDDSLDSSPRFN